MWPNPTTTNTRIADLSNEVTELKIQNKEYLETIKNLREELAKCTDNDSIDANQNKKRKRDEQENDVLNVALISDSHDKEITIKRLTEENAKLTEENVILKAKMNPQATDKSDNNKRILPSTPPSPNITKLFEDMQTKMTKQISEMKVSIQTSIEQKMNITQQKTFASAVEGTNNANSHRDKVRNNFREIMMNTKNEELAEENERKSRENNIIIHGKIETSAEQDTQFLNDLFVQLSIGSIKAKSSSRLGVQKADRNRPILVQMQTVDDKNKVMTNLRNLKGLAEYQKISIKDDYTLAERDMVANSKKKPTNSTRSTQTTKQCTELEDAQKTACL